MMKIVKATQSLSLPGKIGWHNWGNYFNDPTIWEPVVVDIFSDLDLVADPSYTMGYPGTCAVFVVNGELVLKIFPPMLPDDFAKEYLLYKKFNGRTEYVPALVASGIYEEKLDWPFLIFEYSRGSAIRELFDSLSKEDKAGIAYETGKFFAFVHTCQISDEEPFVSWNSFLAERRADCMAELAGKFPLSTRLRREINKLLRDIVPAIQDIETVIVNADLTEDHVLLLKEDDSWRLDKIIDWADAEIGPREFEWVAAWFGFCQRNPEMFMALLGGYDPAWQPDQNFRKRMLVYTLLHRFGSVIIHDLWRGDGKPKIASLTAMLDWLWPKIN